MKCPSSVCEISAELLPDVAGPAADADAGLGDRVYGSSFWLAYAANTLVCVGMAMLYRYADFVNVLGGSELHLGWIIGIGWVGSVFARFLLGRGIDQYGTRIIWLASLAVLAATCFGHLAVSRYDGMAVYALRIAFCTALAGIFGSATTFIAARVEGPRTAELIGMLGTSGFIGMVLGTQLSDVLSDAEPSQAGVFRMFLAAGLASAAAIPFAAVATRGQSLRTNYRHLPMLRVIGRYHPGMLLGVAVATGAALTLPQTFLRTYAAELGIPRIGMFFGVVGITAVTARVVSRRLPEKVGLRPMILIGLATMALAQVTFCLVHSEWQLAVPGFVHGIAQAILYPTITAAGTMAFPIRYRGMGTTLVLAALDIGQFVGAPTAGMILHFSQGQGGDGYPAMFLSMAAAVVLVGCAVLFCQPAVVVDRALDAFEEADLGFIAEQRARAADVGHAFADISGSGGGELRSNAGAEHLIEGGEQLEKRDRATAGEIDHLARHSGGIGGQEIAVGHVGHEGEIAGLVPVAVDDRLAALEDGGNEQRDHGRVGAGRVLSGTEDVEIAQRDRFEAVGGGEGLGIVLGGQLCRSIGRDRSGEVGFALGDERLVAIGAGGSGVDDAADARLAGRVEQIDGCGHTMRMRGERGFDAQRHRGQGGLVKDAVDLFHGPGHGCGVEQIAADEFDAVPQVIEVRFEAGAEIVEHADGIAPPHQGLGDMGADEARASGNQESTHESTSLPLDGGSGLRPGDGASVTASARAEGKST